jgi:WD40 repeat protein
MSDGQFVTWGSNRFGQCLARTADIIRSPTLVSSLSEPFRRGAAVSGFRCGSNHVAFLINNDPLDLLALYCAHNKQVFLSLLAIFEKTDRAIGSKSIILIYVRAHENELLKRMLGSFSNADQMIDPNEVFLECARCGNIEGFELLLSHGWTGSLLKSEANLPSETSMQESLIHAAVSKNQLDFLQHLFTRALPRTVQSQQQSAGSALAVNTSRCLSSGDQQRVAYSYIQNRSRVSHSHSKQSSRQSSVKPFMCFSPSSDRIAFTLGRKSIRLFDIRTKTFSGVLREHRDIVRHISFSPSGLLLASASEDWTVRVWDTSSNSLTHVFTGHSAPVNHCEFSVGSELNWLGSGVIVSASEDGTCRIWSLATNSELLSIPIGSTVKSDAPRRLFACFDSNRTSGLAENLDDVGTLATCNTDKSISVYVLMRQARSFGEYQLLVRETITLRGGHKAWIRRCWFVESKKLISAGDDRRICVWNLCTGQLIQHLPCSSWRACRISDNGIVLILDGVIYVWEKRKYIRLESLSHDQDETSEGSEIVALDSNHQVTVALRGTSTIEVWENSSNRHNLEDRQPIFTRSSTFVESQRFISLHLSPSATLVAALCDNHTIIIWDILTEAKVVVVEPIRRERRKFVRSRQRKWGDVRSEQRHRMALPGTVALSVLESFPTTLDRKIDQEIDQRLLVSSADNDNQYFNLMAKSVSFATTSVVTRIASNNPANNDSGKLYLSMTDTESNMSTSASDYGYSSSDGEGINTNGTIDNQSSRSTKQFNWEWELDLNTVHNGHTPLHSAIAQKLPQASRLLIRNAASIHAVNSKGKQPLDLCSSEIERDFLLKIAHEREVFISYTHCDSGRIGPLRDSLEHRFIRCWMDDRWLEAGGDWRQSIGSGMKECRVVLFAATRASVRSLWCLKELKLAQQWGKETIAIILDEGLAIPDYLDGFLHKKHRYEGWKGQSQILPQILPLLYRIRNRKGGNILQSKFSMLNFLIMCFVCFSFVFCFVFFCRDTCTGGDQRPTDCTFSNFNQHPIHCCVAFGSRGNISRHNSITSDAQFDHLLHRRRDVQRSF